MEVNPELIYPLLPAGLVLLSLLVAWISYRNAAAARRESREATREIERMQQELRALCSGAVGLGDHLRQLERGLKGLSERHDRLELKDPGERPYAQAIRLVHNGAGVHEIADTCGLTRSEAELIRMLHGVDKAS
ncbi:MAG: hypothetical protein Kow006_23770 [Gammaproteobacteria bacterium]